MENHGICSRCGQAVKHENLILIYGKYYGPDCAQTVLGHGLPGWFRGGEWAEVKAKHEIDKDAQIRDVNECRESMRENWDFVKRFSEAFHQQRVQFEITGKEWAVNFLCDMALKHGIQMTKETARRFDTFEDFAKNDTHYERFKRPQLSEKQQSLLNRLVQ